MGEYKVSKIQLKVEEKRKENYRCKIELYSSSTALKEIDAERL
jgi:hypothetical protein